MLHLQNQKYLHQNSYKNLNCFTTNEPILSKKVQNYLFKLNDQIGTGNFSHVYKAINEKSGQLFAIKVVQLNRMKKQPLIDLLHTQIQNLRSLSHPNILKYHQAFISSNNCYIITQFCNQGDLETKLKKTGHINKLESYQIIFEVFKGLKYLYDRKIVHRDLKTTNILFKDGKAKIADFGFSKKIKQKIQDISIGSPIYMSPQGLIYHIYGPKTDVWSFGILMYQLMHGYPPMHFCKNQDQLKKNIVNQLTIDDFNSEISKDLRELIIRCLDVNQHSRISIEQIQTSIFINKMRILFNQNTKETILISNVKQITFPSNQYNSDKNLKNSRVSTQAPTIKHLNQNQIDKPTKFTETMDKIKNNKQFYLENQQNLISPQNSMSIFYSPRQRLNKIDQTRRMKLYENNILYNEQSTKRKVSIEKLKSKEKTKFNKSKPNILDHQSLKVQNFNKNQKIFTLHSHYSFSQCVNLLHYCRLLYRFITLYKKNFRFLEDTIKKYTIWLFQIIDEISNIVWKYIRCQSQSSFKRLKDVIEQYHKKYHKQLDCILNHQKGNTNLKKIQQMTIQTLNQIDDYINSQQYQKKQMFILAQNIYSIFEINCSLQKCKKENEFNSLWKDIEIQEYISMQKQNCTINNYLKLKHKFQKHNSHH